MAASNRTTIDSSYGIPEELEDAALPRRYRPARKVRTPIWQRIIAMGTLGGITVMIGVALAVALIGLAVLTLMLLESAIG